MYMIINMKFNDYFLRYGPHLTASIKHFMFLQEIGYFYVSKSLFYQDKDIIFLWKNLNRANPHIFWSKSIFIFLCRNNILYINVLQVAFIPSSFANLWLKQFASKRRLLRLSNHQSFKLQTKEKNCTHYQAIESTYQNIFLSYNYICKETSW